MFKLFIFAAVLAFAAATANPGLISSYSSPGYIASGYSAPLALPNAYYGGYASPYAYNTYNAYSAYNLPYAYRY